MDSAMSTVSMTHLFGGGGGGGSLVNLTPYPKKESAANEAPCRHFSEEGNFSDRYRTLSYLIFHRLNSISLKYIFKK